MNRRNLFWGSILIFIGIIFLLDNLCIMDFGNFISTFWPLILVLIGIKIIVDRRRKEGADSTADFSGSGEGIDLTGDRFKENRTFGDIIRNVKSDDFAGGEANNIFGDIKIDLSATQIKNKDCRVTLNSVFGDVTVILPKGVPVKAKTSAVAGDLLIKGNRRDGFVPNLEYMDPNYESSRVRVFVQAGIVFGSVNIF